MPDSGGSESNFHKGKHQGSLTFTSVIHVSSRSWCQKWNDDEDCNEISTMLLPIHKDMIKLERQRNTPEVVG